MQTANHRNERGVTLILSLLALLLLSAIATGLLYMSSTETLINANFKAEETEYFAARAGIEEVRDRMLSGSTPYSINSLLPTALPTSSNQGVLYVLQSGVTMANVTTAGNSYFDDELCHDYTIGTMTQSSTSNVRCASLPSGTGWYQSTNALAALSNPVIYPLDYKWVRITLKANNSVLAYPVDSSAGTSNSDLVCWNGTSEVRVAGVTSVPFPGQNPSCVSLSSPTPSNQVYMITALAVNASGARRIVQEEAAITPTSGFNAGLFATSTGCGAIQITGGSKTYSFNAAGEHPPSNPPSNITSSGGNVATNGNVLISGGTQVNGIISSAINANTGSCPGNGITSTGGSSDLGTSAIGVQTPAVPPIPNPAPPTSNTTYHGTYTLTAGAYGNVSITGGSTVTLTGGTQASPAVYTMNSIVISGGSNLILNGWVVINIDGAGQNPAVDLTGGSFQNNAYMASQFVINYGGTNGVNVSGGSGSYGVINAPNAPVTFTGGSRFYGSVVGSTIADTGGTDFYYDTSLSAAPSNGTQYYPISMRELSY